MEDLQQLMELVDIDNLDIPGSIEAEEEENPLYEPPEFETVVSNPTQRNSDLESDYASAREMVHFQQQVLKIAMLKQLENASMGDLPRQMEVLATLSSQVTNNTKQLLDIHKQMKDNTEETVKTAGEGGGATHIANQQVFVGNTSDLLDNVGSRQEHLRDVAKAEVIEGEVEGDGET